MERHILKRLSPEEYAHPFDLQALDVLKGTPGLEPACKAMVKFGYEKILLAEYTGSNLKITSKVCPNEHRLLLEACKVLDMPVPEAYIQWSYNINAGTMGWHRPLISLYSGAVDLLSEEELLFLLGHELGHIKSLHQLYHSLGSFIQSWGSYLGQVTLGVGNAISAPLKLALFYWQRMSEFTADRAGLLVSQNIETVLGLKMKFAGLPLKYHGKSDYREFIKQAEEFKSLDYDRLNATWKFLLQLQRTHPWMVIRAAELLKWSETSQYKDLIAGNRESEIIAVKKRKYTCRGCGRELRSSDESCPVCGTEGAIIFLE